MLVVALVMYVGFFMKTRKTHKGTKVVAKGAGTGTRCGVLCTAIYTGSSALNNSLAQA